MATIKSSLWFVSDVHLESSAPQRTLLFESFLESLIRKRRKDPISVTHFFLLGDIFDLWVGGHSFFHRKHQKVVDLILELQKLGVQIFYIEGNHDVHIESFWKSHGVTVSRQALEIVFSDGKVRWNEFPLLRWQQSESTEISISDQGTQGQASPVKPMNLESQKILTPKISGQFTLRVEHGDYINPDDQIYLNYLEFIRKPALKYLAAALPGFLWSYLGEKASQQSRKKSRAPQQQDERKQKLLKLHRQYAQVRFQERPFDLLVSGHVHQYDHFISLNGFQAINLGSWLEAEPHVQFIELHTNGEFSLKRYRVLDL